MQDAEHVILGGPGFDRVDHLRGDGAALKSAAQEGRTRAIIFWQGMPLVAGGDRDRLVRLAPDHPVLGAAAGAEILIGRDRSGDLVFGHDISDQSPK